MSAVMTANVALAATNLLLMSVLIVLYVRLIWQVRTPLTMGLLAFASVLWVQNAVQLYFFATMMEYYAGGVENIVLVQNVLAAVAAAFLVAVSLFPGGIRNRSPAPS